MPVLVGFLDNQERAIAVNPLQVRSIRGREVDPGDSPQTTIFFVEGAVHVYGEVQEVWDKIDAGLNETSAPAAD